LVEKIITLENISLIDFLGIENQNIKQLAAAFPGSKIISRGNEIKIQGKTPEITKINEILLSLIEHYHKFGKITNNNVNKFISPDIDIPDEVMPSAQDVLLYGSKGGIIKAKTPNQQRLVDAVEKNDLVFALGPAGTGKTYISVALAVFNDFPEGTVHLVAVDSQGSAEGRYHAVKYKNHYFLAADNGILSLLTDSRPDVMVEINTEGPVAHPARQVLGPAAAFLAQGGDLKELGTETKSMRELLNRQLRLTDHAITGHVIHVDHYGNLITDISQDSIDAIGHGRQFTVKFGRETVDRISANFNAADEGDCVCVFTSAGQLTIGINKGNAAELLGLYFDSRVDINFTPAS
jgi:S-adenosyl-L-methionine hydrolase (adenosine-forming)